MIFRMIFDLITFVALLQVLIATIKYSSAQGFRNISEYATEPTNSLLQVYAIPVGQGDCTVIQCPNGNIIVFNCRSSGGSRVMANQVQNWLSADINCV